MYDGSAIRELEGSKSGAINGMHISQDGKHFVTGMTHFIPFFISLIQSKVNPVGIYKFPASLCA